MLDEGLLELLRAKIDAAEFVDLEKKGERRGTPADKSLNALLIVLLSDKRLFKLVEELSGCPPIARLTGGVYRMEPGARHFVSWHGDLGETSRVMTLTVNLGREPVRGGLFQIRKADETRLLAELPYERGGDGILFRLHPGLRHRSTRVVGTVPKTIFSCWFHTS